MSRLGKKPLQLPEKVKAEFKDNVLTITGPLGKLSHKVGEMFTVKTENNSVLLHALKNTVETSSRQGLHRGIIKNMIEGVTKGFKKDLEVNGLGYKAAVEGKDIVMQLGLSHPVRCTIPEGLKVTIEKQTLVTVSGMDKALVGDFAAVLRSYRQPEPYKGTGIKYVGEHIIRKAGKSAAGAGAGAGAGGGGKK